MRILALFLLLLFQDVEIRPRLVAGDAFRLEIVRARENSQRPQGNGTSRTPVDVRVVSAGPQGVQLDWIPGPTTFDNPLVTQDPTVAAAARAMQQIQIRIVLNEDGEFAGVANEAQLSQQLQTVTNAVLKELMGAIPEAQRPQLESLMRQILAPPLLISSATREAQIYFGLNGAVLAPGETVEVPLDQPSPFGGGTLAATYRVRMDSSAPDSAALSTMMIYDPEGLQAMTAAFVKQMGATVPQSELAAMPAIRLTDEGKYSYDMQLGLMREVTVNRRIAAGPVQRLDGWTIRLVSAPKR